jgi:hypothetical protein
MLLYRKLYFKGDHIMATKDFRRKMALKLCPELKQEIANLVVRTKHLKDEVRLLKELNDDYVKRNNMLRETLNDQLELFNSIMEAKGEDAPDGAFERILEGNTDEIEKNIE